MGVLVCWKRLYTAYISTHQELVWSPYLKGDIAKLEDVQRRTTKIAHAMKGNDYVERLRLLDV